MRKTSIKSFYELKESGELTKMQRRVFDYVKCSGPVTGRDISKMVDGGHKRMSELEDLGLISRQGTTKDRATGKIVALWAITNQPLLPKVIQKKVRYKPDGVELGKFYDKAFEAGIRATLSHVFIGMTPLIMDNAVKQIQAKH